MAKLSSSTKELRLAYQCTNKQWCIWLQPLFEKGIIKKHTKKYTPKQIKAIIDELGQPD